jgi:membrane-bound metal-dependent hydrolase YbcI (DUF457 family)
MAAGWLIDGRPAEGAADGRVASLLDAVRAGALFAVLGMAPDLDLLVGLHSTYTHSLAAVAVVTAIAWTQRRGRRARWAVACGGAVASHILLDWLGSDTTPPIGITALWPFSADYYQSSLNVFPAVSRRFGEWSFVVQNTKAALFETAVLVPIAAAIARARRVMPGAEAPGPDPRPRSR